MSDVRTDFLNGLATGDWKIPREILGESSWKTLRKSTETQA